VSNISRQHSDVYINEIDLSTSITSNSNATAAAVIVSAMGPTTPTFYSTADDFTFDFGNPNASVSFDHYAVLDYFKEGNSLWAVRGVGTGAAISAGVMWQSVASPAVTTIGGISGGVADPTFLDWGTYVPSGTALFRFITKRGPGSYGNSVGISIDSENVNQVTGGSAALVATGGTLPAATYGYKVAAISKTTEGLASASITQVVASGSTNCVTLSWAAVPGAVGYKIYGRTVGTELYIATVGGATLTYTDTGAITPAVGKAPIILAANLVISPVFTLNVFDSGVSTTTPVESFKCSVTEQTDETGSQMEITQRVNPFSNYLRVDSAVYLVNDPTTIRVTAVTSPVYLTGGASGATPTTSNLLTQWNLFLNKELYTVDVLINAGKVDPVLQTGMDYVARTRNDSVAFLDVPSGTQKAQSAVDFRNITLNLNSSYSALFCSDLLELDPINGKMLFIPPSGAMAALYARTSRIAKPWFSMAGLNRGLLGVQSIRNSYTDGEANLLFQSQVNYMRKFVGRGIPLWEQSTLYNKNSALQFLNVRFLCNILKRSVYEYLIYGLQEPNDDILRKQLTLALEDYLKVVKAGRGISSFRVVCDDTNNPPAVVNSGTLAIAVIIVPILAVHAISLSLVLSKVGYEVTEAELASFAG